MESSNGDGRYEVVYLESVRTRLKIYAKLAKDLGVAVNFRESLLRIDRILHRAPLELGEPMFDPKNPAGQARVGGHGLILFDYVVYFEKRAVMVYWIHVMLKVQEE